MASDKNTLIIIDGHASVHRAYHAIKDTLTNSRGEPTSAVYTFLNLFMRLHRQLRFEHLVVVFDPPGPSFREGIYAEYKANRPSTPPELIQQDKRIRQLLRLLNVNTIEIPGLEADDVIGALALRAIEAGGEALICSVDKDLLQLVRPGVRVWREHLNKTELLDEEGVRAKMGVAPAQIPDYLGLLGDTSDNIPGVKGIGDKTAVKLLAEYGNLEAILAAAPSMKKSKMADNLQEFAADARLSRELATIKTDCVTDFSWDRFRWTYQPGESFRSFLREMEFRAMLKELGPTPEGTPPLPEPESPGGPDAPAQPEPVAAPDPDRPRTIDERTVDYRTLTTRGELEQAVAEIRRAGLAAIDTETTDLDPYFAELVGVSISWRTDQAVYIPVGHRARDARQMPIEELRQVLAPALRDPAVKWVAHHWDFDYKILKMAGLHPATIASDTMIAAFVANPERGDNSLRLKALSLSLLGIRMTEISELIGAGDDLVTMSAVSVEDSSRYACQDADATLQLHHRLSPLIDKAGVRRLYDDVELPLINVLAEMELEGVRIDRDYFRQLSLRASGELQALTAEIHRMVGRPFNINSPKQVGEILFDELKLPGGKKGKTGAYGTDMSVLESLAGQHPLPSKLLEYRQAEKLKGTYIDPLPTMIHPKTGRVHSEFRQTIAATGRLSSSNPNLQNIPVRTEAGRQIRQGFVPRATGWKFLAADYSQIELRILASLSGDEALCDAFRTGGDIHKLTASKVFGVPLDEVTPAQRDSAKAINFGIIYGMSDFGLSQALGIPRAQAKKFIEDYFAIYSGVKGFIDETKENARRDGYVTTLLGRRRLLPDIKASNANQRNFAERVAVNTPIQGTSADMIKIAMIRVDARLRAEGFRARMVLQVHDELIFDVPGDEVERLRPLVVGEMTNAIPLRVPIKVDVAVGDNWAEV